MRFVDDQQRDPIRDGRDHVLGEPRIRQTLRGDQQNVDLARAYFRLDLFPFFRVVGMDRPGLDTKAFCCHQLIAHQRKQRRDQ